MAEHWEYDAFISYRHLELDQAVADRLQKLLESYRAPRSLGKNHKLRIGRIFRDRTELPTSGDLDNALQQALLSSEFLIVILSRKLKESIWCMEEIRTFKEAHGGRINRILPILVDGEPSESLPDILRYETREVKRPDGQVEKVEVAVEPLCCDVRADSIKGSLKKLKVEFLRIAAPMLGVGFDDLYQRHARRKRRNAVIASSSIIALLTAVLSVISYFAYQTYQAQLRYEGNLVDTYARQGAAQITAGDYEQAMMYYGDALRLDDQTQAAKTGALLLLQQHGWLNHEDSGSGEIIGDLMYAGDQRPTAIDAAGEKLLNYSRLGCYLTNADGGETQDFSEYGEFLSSARDGSCWTFITEDTITFYFTADASIAQVERPTAINPQCDTESVKYFANDLPEAMAIRRTRAAVCYGGYLYLYNLSEDSAQGELFETFDLSQVFEYEGMSQTLEAWAITWFDDGGYLAVLYDGAIAAVFNIANADHPCLNALHTAYDRNLQSVAFSADGAYYALVYGNDDGISNNPGGCLEVYDEFGNRMFATEFNGGTALTGAAFEPNGNRIAAWGNGKLCVWDCATGAQAAAPLRISKIASAVWLDDGRLAVDDGKGRIDYYSIAHYEADDGPVILLNEYEEQNQRQQEVTLRSGYHFLRTSMKVGVADADGNPTDERWLDELGLDAVVIDHMFLDVAHDSVYAWYSTSELLLAFKVDDAGKIISVDELNTRGQKPKALYSVWNGILAEMGTGELLYYADGSTHPDGILNPGTAGSIRSIASDGNGLVSFVIRNQNYTDGYTFVFTYSVELWDLNKNVMLAEMVKGSRNEITGLTFTDDSRLAFAQGSEIVAWLLDAPAPDSEVIDTLRSISCYQLDEAQNTRITDAAFAPEALGNWSDLLHLRAQTAAAEEKGLTEEWAAILQEQGEDAWLEACGAWWDSAAPEGASSLELCDTMRSCFNAALSAGMEQKMRPSLERFFAILYPKLDLDSVANLRMSYLICDMMFYTPENTDLAAEYYDKLADCYAQAAAISGDPFDLYCEYDCRVTAGLIRGDGLEAFRMDDPAYDGYIDAFLQMGPIVNADLLLGYPEEAAELRDILIPAEDAGDYQDMLNELICYVKLGYISEADYSEFVRSLEHTVGLRLTQVTSEHLEAGLRLGDVVVAVNDIYFGMPRYLELLQQTLPSAAFTVVRGEDTFTTEIMDDWVLSGSYAY